MRITSRQPLRDFTAKHPEAKAPLDHWWAIVKRASWKSFADLRRTFPSADKVGRFVVFNVGGNNYRLIAAIHFNTERVFVRSVLTHREYDLGKWKE